MAKTKFDPNTIAARRPAGGLEPLDFMRPMPESSNEQPSEGEPTTTKATVKPQPVRKAKPTAPTRPVAGADVLPMPPARQPQVRVNVNARLKLELNERLRGFVQARRANMQDTIEMAIEEFLARRGG